MPTAENVHEIAHTIDPATRVVYLDNDPVVLAHARALLADDKVTFAAAGDLRDPAGRRPPPAASTRIATRSRGHALRSRTASSVAAS